MGGDKRGMLAKELVVGMKKKGNTIVSVGIVWEG